MSFDLSAELARDDRESVAEDVDSAAESAGEIPPGKYPARLDSAKKKDEVGVTPMWEMYFIITGGRYRGRKVKYTLWMGSKGEGRNGVPLSADEIAHMKQTIINEYDHACRVLGVKVKTSKPGEPSKYRNVEGKRDFRDALGVECVVETKLRASTTPGDDRKFSEVVKFGLHSYGDPKSKGVERPAAGTAPPVSKSPEAVVGGAADYSDLAAGV